MPFADFEESRSLGEPDSFYRFTLADRTWSFTDAEEDADDGYTAIPIDRDAISTQGNLDRSAIIVRVPVDNPVAMLFRYTAPAERVGLTIFVGHDAQRLAIWIGRVLSAKVEGSECSLNCEPISTSMRRPGLRVRDQYQCMHALYGPSCRADRSRFTRTTTVTAVAGATLTLATGWQGAFAAQKFANGILRFGLDQRQILRVNGDQLLIDGPTQGLAAGASVDVSLGCGHTMDDCLKVFNNIHNFGGCPFIPKKNPIGFVNQFY